MFPDHRKLLLFDQNPTRVSLVVKKLDCNLCPLNQKDCSDDCKTPPPLIPSRDGGGGSNSSMPTVLILMLSVLGAAFVFLCYLTILKRYRSNLTSSSSRRRRRRDGTDTEASSPVGIVDEEIMDENQGRMMMINPIWYINTVGLQQSVIDSILVFKYKKGKESLIESSDCSVCLSEFQEDENLRLLPKCNHAFHIECIDTWLRSHKNCPLCRAPIVCESVSETEDENSNPENHLTMAVSATSATDAEEQEDNENNVGEQTDSSISTGGIDKRRNNGFRVLSDLSDHQRLRKTGEKEEEEKEEVRRSVSMDATSATLIYTEMATKVSYPVIIQEQGEGCSKIQELKKPISDEVYKSRKSFSFGKSLQKMPIRMKRSFSSSSSSSSSSSNSKIKSSLPRNRSVAEVRS